MKVVAIVQARMGSTRLPGKVLMDLAGRPVLSRVIARLGRAERLDAVVIATTTEPADDAIEEFCAERGWPCFRGSENDVLDRYYQAARAHQADVVVRITSDCPLIDPVLVDHIVDEFLQTDASVDYVSNSLPTDTFPRGLDVEVVRFEALKRAWTEAKDARFREHVTLYIYSHPETFRLRGVVNDVDLSHMRWTVDTKEDLALVRSVYRHFGDDQFSWRDLLALLDLHPEWLAINRKVRQKEV